MEIKLPVGHLPRWQNKAKKEYDRHEIFCAQEMLIIEHIMCEHKYICT